MAQVEGTPGGRSTHGDLVSSTDIPEARRRELCACEELLGYQFKNVEWLQRALTHSSESLDAGYSNERLEFLGDAVLGLVVSRWLYERLPGVSEGELTRIKSVVVSRRTLASVSAQKGLEGFIRVGKGLAEHRLPRSILANTFEAIIAAIYLDGGLRRAQRFIKRHLEDLLERVQHRENDRNFKSLLQQFVQAHGWPPPVYRVVGEKGPDHDREFEVEVLVGGECRGRGSGRAKRQAEQRAAEVALRSVREEVDDRLQ